MSTSTDMPTSKIIPDNSNMLVSNNMLIINHMAIDTSQTNMYQLKSNMMYTKIANEDNQMITNLNWELNCFKQLWTLRWRSS
jgi:hypothetical protein